MNEEMECSQHPKCQGPTRLPCTRTDCPGEDCDDNACWKPCKYCRPSGSVKGPDFEAMQDDLGQKAVANEEPLTDEALGAVGLGPSVCNPADKESDRG